MVPRRVLAILPIVLGTPASADAMFAATDRLRVWSDDQYARLVLDARELGRRYSEEDVASGARRHYEEVRAQYCDATSTALAPDTATYCGRAGLPIP